MSINIQQETVNELAGKITQSLIDHGIIPESKKHETRTVIYLELDNEFLKPMKEYTIKTLYKEPKPITQ